MSRARVSWLQIPIRAAKDRRLRILIYARYSTEEQNPLSIEDQVGYCKHFLEIAGVVNVEIAILYDAEMSGERVSRPGIDQVRAGIESGLWDVIIVEDSSRLFRNETACAQLVGMAVDQEIRVVCVNDEVDTADEDRWERRLLDAARHHADSNRDTSARIKRAFEGLWEGGAAIGKLKPGYRRVPTYPATAKEPASGPFFDELDPAWTSVMHEAYERIAAKESPWSVGEWLTQEGFPKANGATSAVYTAKNVIAFIHRKDHRGLQEFWITSSKKVFRTGRRKSKRNSREKIATREMPHLRVVPDDLFQKAVDAIAARRRRKNNMPSGAAHPLAKIPRDSRGPLSGIFFCGRCPDKPGKMHMDGRNEGGYRCSNSRRGDCWNKATAVRLLTHRQVGAAIVETLRGLDEELDRLVAQVSGVLRDDGTRQDRRDALCRQEHDLRAALENLGKVAEEAREPPDVIVALLHKRQEELERVVAEQECLAREAALLATPTRAELVERIAQLIPLFTRMERSVQVELKTLVPRIEAVPCQQFGSNKVVLRARFELQLAGLLPLQTRATLAGVYGGPIGERFGTIPITVDLFEPSTGPKFGLAALKLQEGRHLGLTAIGKELGITKREANIATQYGKALRAAARTDPFIELTEPPAAASRWRMRRGSSGAGNRPS
jgi:DNA invertase Pin-like site-specific DNA recombinase